MPFLREMGRPRSTAIQILHEKERNNIILIDIAEFSLMLKLEHDDNPQRTKVSVIITCHNLGQYIDEAVKSVLAQTYEDFEIILVDDGSTDEETLEVLKDYHPPKTRVIRTSNQGLACSRNNGIKACTGKYILPLDADDKFGRIYLEKAVRLLEANEKIGIVYCKAEYFGKMTGPWNLPPYRFPDILLNAMIFCSAMFRKSDWTKVKGYNPNMVYGWEDYDFWLSLIEFGREVVYIPETLFFRRVRSRSMTATMTREQLIYSYTQLFRNHAKLYSENLDFLIGELLDLKSKLHHAQNVVRFMELVKFGKLQRLWWSLKRMVKLRYKK
jgi:glycosyltransferase involved in cell wall biosynthesis